jgi:hypothetical protein
MLSDIWDADQLRRCGEEATRVRGRLRSRRMPDIRRGYLAM